MHINKGFSVGGAVRKKSLRTVQKQGRSVGSVDEAVAIFFFNILDGQTNTA